MTVFWLAAVTLTLLALALVLPPLLRPAAARNSAAPPPRQASLAILRGQLAQLDAERDAGRWTPRSMKPHARTWSGACWKKQAA